MESSDRWRVVTARLSLADRNSPDAQIVQHLPSPEQVLTLFAHLSRSEGGDLFISGEPGHRVFMVGGGPSLYLANFIDDRHGAYNLVEPAAGRDGWLTLHVGGLPSAVEASSTVEAELTKRAIRYFLAHGCIDPELQWE